LVISGRLPIPAFLYDRTGKQGSTGLCPSWGCQLGKRKGKRSSNLMTVSRDEVKDAANRAFHIWVEQPELIWAEKAWAMLHDAKLTAYTNELERYQVLLRLLVLGGIYSDFCDAAWEERSEPDYGYWAEPLELDPFLLGRLYAKLQNLLRMRTRMKPWRNWSRTNATESSRPSWRLSALYRHCTKHSGKARTRKTWNRKGMIRSKPRRINYRLTLGLTRGAVDIADSCSNVGPLSYTPRLWVFIAESGRRRSRFTRRQWKGVQNVGRPGGRR
jgi:hypothetical protein